jgi:glycosyltransferase involved in cell wall biosynthesis
MLSDLPCSEVQRRRQTNGLPLVSIVVPTWNRPAHLKECLASLIAQEYPKSAYEIIVADDGSSVETAAVTQGIQIEAGSLRVRHCRQEHRGVNAARNLGIETAVGEFIAFIDDDELVPPGYLEQAVLLMDQHPDVIGVGGPCKEYGTSALRTCGRCSLAARYPSRRLMRMDNLPGGNMVIRHSAFAELGCFDEQISGYGDEWEWFMRIRGRAAVGFLYDPGLWIWHRKDLLPAWRLLATAFRQGFAEPIAARKAGVSYRPSLVRVARYLGHATLRRCGGGLILAARHSGALVQHVQLRLGWRVIP